MLQEKNRLKNLLVFFAFSFVTQRKHVNILFADVMKASVFKRHLYKNIKRKQQAKCPGKKAQLFRKEE